MLLTLFQLVDYYGLHDEVESSLELAGSNLRRDGHLPSDDRETARRKGKMDVNPETNYLRDVQYRTPVNLQARMAVHVLFSSNKYGWPRWLFDRFDIPPSADVLEVGCGPGTVWKSNADRVPEGWRLTLTDFSEGMIDTARTNLADGPSAKFKVADAQELPFPDESFDAVMAHHMLYHVPDKKLALSEFRRVLRKDGVFYAATNGPRHLRQLRDLIKRSVPDATSTVNSDSFDLVNAPLQIGEFLEIGSVEEYPDSLEVTRPGPLIEYIRSMVSADEICDAALAAIERDLVETIDTKGAFHIDKQAGLITARLGDTGGI